MPNLQSSYLLRRTWLAFNRQLSSSVSPFSFKELFDIVAIGVGSLEDMQTNLERMNIEVTPVLTNRIFHSCKTLPPATSNGCSRSRRLLRFFTWSLSRSHGSFGDDVFNNAIRAFSAMKDLAAMGIAVSELHKVGSRMKGDTFALVSETLVNAGRADEAIQLFRDMMENQKLELPHGGDDTLGFITTIVHALCSKGHARKAEGVVWHHKDKIQQNIGVIHMILLHGWCIYGNVKEAKRILREMKSEGINPGLASYNDLLRCICERNVKFNPSGIISEAADLMLEMRSSGIMPTTVSFNILLSCLSRARRVQEACRVLSSMMQGEVESSSSPDQVTYFLVIRLLYLTKRIVKGNRIFDHMISRRVVVEARFFHCLIGILCGIGDVNRALAMLNEMKSQCKGNIGPTYDLLIEKLCRNGNFDEGRRLYDDAIKNGVILRISRDLLDPLKTQVFKPPLRSGKNLIFCKYKSKVLKKTSKRIRSN
ncbi:Pentatricopeptide repeat-containing protein [Platanthera guangdongensis]|uniref:Pentatricopeptide repeat-containing protein n=1 Tax=Platanthera guangdongensis TaxID=2320717 RepID=A0ABR2MYS4_9ASPA